MYRSRTLLMGAACVVVAGCASTPDVTMRYYLPMSTASIKAVRTVGCTPQALHHVTSVIAPVITYSRDTAAPKELRFKAIDGTFVNSSMGITLTDDGRLKGVNAATTGRGEDIVKAAAQIAAAAIGLPSVPAVPKSRGEPPRVKSPQEVACDLIQAHGKDGFVTLNYGTDLAFQPSDRPEVKLSEASPSFHAAIDRLLPKLCAYKGEGSNSASPVKLGPKVAKQAGTYIHLRQPANVDVWVVGSGGDIINQPAELSNQLCPPTQNNLPKLMQATVMVPQLGAPYSLPIPKGAMFGAQSFTLGLADSGAVTELKYGSDSGAAAVLNSANAIYGAFDSTAREAAALKAQADLIAQQQRVLKCRMKPAECA